MPRVIFHTLYNTGPESNSAFHTQMGDRPPETPDMGEDALGLMEVEPSPVADTPIELREGYFESKPASGTQSPVSSTLGLGNHGVGWYRTYSERLERWMVLTAAVTRVQKYSSYAFTVFTAMHIANTSLIPLATKSVAESNRYLLLTRPYYQSALAEPLLVSIPLVAHVASGIALRFYRRRQALYRYGAETKNDRRTIPWPSFSGTSALGYMTAVVAISHAWTTRGLPLYMHGDSSLISLSYVSHSFELFPYLGFAGMTALVGISTWHAVWGWAKWLGYHPSQVKETESQKHLTRKRRWYIINAVSAAISGLWLAGGLFVVGRGGRTAGWVGKEFDELWRHLPVIGRWALVATIP